MNVKSESITVSCDGLFDGEQGSISENSKHPLVYFKVTKHNDAECPYCGKIFKYVDKD